MQQSFDYKNDILPVGDFEAIPVYSSIEPVPENFPNYIRLNIQVDVTKLRQEWEVFPKDIVKHYWRQMAKHFKNSLRETLEIFKEQGFKIDNYKVFPLRAIGTNTLSENVGPYTREVLENVGVPLFRQQYVYATSTWETNTHFDHPTFAIHGFRMFIPIDPAYMIVDGEDIELTPGFAYFVNIARPHKAFSKGERVVIMAQMASDKLIQEALSFRKICNENRAHLFYRDITRKQREEYYKMLGRLA
jgi:hypothetical protein